MFAHHSRNPLVCTVTLLHMPEGGFQANCSLRLLKLQHVALVIQSCSCPARIRRGQSRHILLPVAPSQAADTGCVAPTDLSRQHLLTLIHLKMSSIERCPAGAGWISRHTYPSPRQQPQQQEPEARLRAAGGCRPHQGGGRGRHRRRHADVRSLAGESAARDVRRMHG